MPLTVSRRNAPADIEAKAASVKRRLSQAFRALRRKGYVCKHSWKCCMGCGNDAMPEGTTKAVFYHRQDAATLVSIGAVRLAWSGDGTEIAEAMRAVNLIVEWDGSDSTRIRVKI